MDLLIVRELTGGLYYGEPRGRDGDAAVNTLRYTVPEIERVARVAFEAARRPAPPGDLGGQGQRAGGLPALARDGDPGARRSIPDVRLEHLYVDYAAMRLVADPAAIDVLLTENLFGDILSDEAAVLSGSLGLLPSASVGDGPGLFEPVHGSAPDIAGRGIANPLGAIASAAMLLRYGLGQAEAADAVDLAVADVLAGGVRTPDIAGPGEPTLGTREVGERVARAVLGGRRRVEVLVRGGGAAGPSSIPAVPPAPTTTPTWLPSPCRAGGRRPRRWASGCRGTPGKIR